jgi:hypothetical protein
MFGLDSIVRQVKRNCRISDFHHAGLYSVCGLALCLRDLYTWEREHEIIVRRPENGNQ